MQKLLAATINLQPPSSDANFGALGGLTFPSIISAMIRLAVVVAAIVFFFILVIGGIRWIASGGDKAQTEAARNQITSALVGLVIVFAAWAIVALINVFFGINIFALAIPTV
jgi:TRAP-type C4-dicarboxylate transport system permease small subunit